MVQSSRETWEIHAGSDWSVCERPKTNWLRVSTGVGLPVAVVSLVHGAVSYWMVRATFVVLVVPPLEAVTLAV